MTEGKTLEVKESPIQFGGRARVNSDVLDGLDINEGDQVVLSSKNADVLVSLYADNLLDKGVIKLRGKDRKKLKTENGDEVQLRKHKKLLNKLL